MNNELQKPTPKSPPERGLKCFSGCAGGAKDPLSGGDRFRSVQRRNQGWVKIVIFDIKIR